MSRVVYPTTATHVEVVDVAIWLLTEMLDILLCSLRVYTGARVPNRLMFEQRDVPLASGAI